MRCNVNSVYEMATHLKAKLQRAAQEPKSLGISTQKPKYPQYAVMSKRLESFNPWPEYLPIKPAVLAEAGLVYTGVGDSVRCYHCGGGLRNWERGDRPWVEHVKWYPECGHVMLVKGQKFVDKVLAGSIPDTDGEEEEEEEKKKETVDSDPMKSIAVVSCKEMGFSMDVIKRAVELYISKNGDSNFEGSDIATIALELEDEEVTPEVSTSISSNNVFDSQETTAAEDNEHENEAEDEDAETLRQLAEENNRLKESKACKICLDDIANIIFLPCGHMVSCPMCAPALVKCPICRIAVKGYVKAFFASD